MGKNALGKPWRLLYSLRPHYWLKNFLLFFPAIASHRLRGIELPSPLLLGCLTFSLISSSVYLFNDVFDAPADRSHPRKRLRAVASGRLTPRTALGLSAALACVGATVGAGLPGAFEKCVLLYLGLNVIYTKFAKRIFPVDILLLTFFHLLRVFAGGALLAIPLSGWTISFFFFFFSWAALLKRLIDRVADPAGTNGVPGASRQAWLNYATMLSGFSCLAVGVAYILFSSEATRLYQHPFLLWIPWFSFAGWLFRFWRDVRNGTVHGDPLLWVLLRPGCYLTLLSFMGVIYFTGL